MSIESVIWDRGTTHAGLSALISTRLYPVKLDQDVTMPAIAYHLVSETRESAMGSDPGIVRARFQFDIYDVGSSAELSCINIGEQLRDAFQRWRNTSGTVVQDTFYLDRNWLYNPTGERNVLSADFQFIYVE